MLDELVSTTSPVFSSLQRVSLSPRIMTLAPAVIWNGPDDFSSVRREQSACPRGKADRREGPSQDMIDTAIARSIPSIAPVCLQLSVDMDSPAFVILESGCPPLGKPKAQQSLCKPQEPLIAPDSKFFGIWPSHKQCQGLEAPTGLYPISSCVASGTIQSTSGKKIVLALRGTSCRDKTDCDMQDFMLQEPA